MTRTTVALLALVLVSAAHADDRRPMPVPSRDGICPSGFMHSPTSGYCVPNPGTRSNAVPKRGLAPCPIGTHESMQSFCVLERR